MNKRTQEEFILELKQVQPGLLVIGIYKDNKALVEVEDSLGIR
tara:strand:+ start:344 stop:472 length:129 start_codon:yes stop_codon:yes gene_type:complete